MVSVFRDRILQLHTTRSWDFLEAESGLGSERAHHRAINDVIIGIIDTGMAPSLFSTRKLSILTRKCGGFMLYMNHRVELCFQNHRMNV